MGGLNYMPGGRERRAPEDDRVIPLHRVWVPLTVAHGYRSPVTVARLVMLAYMADWQAAVQYRKRLLKTEWFLAPDGFPASADTAESILKANLTVVPFGATGTLAAVKPPSRGLMLSADWRGGVIAGVVETQAVMTAFELEDAVRATAPVLNAEVGDELDLLAAVPAP